MYIKFKNKNPTNNHYKWLFDDDNRLISVCSTFNELEDRMRIELEKREKEKEKQWMKLELNL